MTGVSAAGGHRTGDVDGGPLDIHPIRARVTLDNLQQRGREGFEPGIGIVPKSREQSIDRVPNLLLS